MVGFGLGLIAVQTLGFNPGLEVGDQRAEARGNALVAADQIVRKKGQRVIGLVLSAVILIGTVAADALRNPLRHIAAQGVVVRMGLGQFVGHGHEYTKPARSAQWLRYR